MRNIALSITLATLALVSQAAAIRTSLTASDTKGKIEFMSGANQTTLDEIQSGSVQMTSKITGEISFPGNGLFGGGVKATANNKVPAMVIMHSSGGINKTIYEWADYFNSKGYATLVVDSFNPRGFSRTAEDQSVMSWETSGVDALMALKLMASHPLIDSKRIGIIGFSKGATAGMMASLESFRAKLISPDIQYAAHILYYGGCSIHGKTTGKPILSLVGDIDDHVGGDRCAFNNDQLVAQGANAKIVVYPNTHHGFDTGNKVTFRPKGYNWVKCGLALSRNFDNGTAVVQGLGSFPTFNAARKASINDPTCEAKGAGSSDGANFDSASKAKKEVESLLNVYFK